MKKNGRERGFLTLVDMDAERVTPLLQAVKNFAIRGGEQVSGFRVQDSSCSICRVKNFIECSAKDEDNAVSI